jgi:phage antirepressor YoqD-like protein
MNYLEATTKTMTSREIAEVVESRHDKVKQSIERLVAKGVISSPPVGNFKNINNVSGTEYLVCKRDSYVIVAQLSPEFTARLVDRWQELEAQQKAPAPRELTRMDLLKMAMEAEQERLLLAARVEEMQPTVAAYDRLTDATNTMTMTDAAKQLKLKPSQLREWMIAHKWIYKLGSAKSWMAYQDRIDSGCMMHKTTTVERDGETSIYSQARVTAKGMATISKHIEKSRKTTGIVGVAA